MILEEITLGNWRGYRQPHTFRFQEGMNLIVGRNEAGKSTLFEALTRAFFDRHGSKTQEICDIMPIRSSSGPSVSVVFKSGEMRFKAVKRFLKDPLSEFYIERDGKWRLEGNGDASDNRLLEILSSEGTSRMAARSEHRGMAQALWYLQTDDPFPAKEWNEGVKNGLQGLIEMVSASSQERKILELLNKVYSEYWTPTGLVKSNSELGLLEVEIPEAMDEVSALREKAKAVDKYRSDLEDQQTQEVQKRGELDNAREYLVEIQNRVGQAEVIGKKREELEQTVGLLRSDLEAQERDLASIEEKQGKIEEMASAIRNTDGELEEATRESKLLAAEAEAHDRIWKEQLEPELKAIEDELVVLNANLDLRESKRRCNRLETHLQRLNELNEKLVEASKSRESLIAPDTKERNHYVKTAERVRELEVKIEASAVKVRFEWGAKSHKVTTKPPIEPSTEGEFSVAEPTEFSISSVGKLHVRSGAESLTDLLQERNQAETKRKDILDRYGVEDGEGLTARHEEARRLDQSIKSLEEQIENAREAEPDAEEELAHSRLKIAHQEAIIKAAIYDFSQMTDSAIETQLSAKGREKKRLIGDIRLEQMKASSARDQHLAQRNDHERNSNALAGMRVQEKGFREAIAEILQKYGTVEQLEKLATNSCEQLENAKSALSQLMENYEEQVETPRKLLEQTNRRIDELEEGLRGINTSVAETNARIEEAAAHGSYAQLADAEIELERKQKRVDALRVRADGAKLLRDLVKGHEQERTSRLSGPIVEQVNKWLETLTEGTYEELIMDGSLKPAGVRVSGFDADLPMTSLSYGAREQVIVLLRLAIGVLVSKDERNLVVIDDRLVNADSLRMKRLCLILQEASQSCQLIVSTCNDTPYAGMGAHVIRVPTDGTPQTPGTS